MNERLGSETNEFISTNRPIKEPKPEVGIETLQEKFELRIDADGVREVVVIGNERPKGCPFKCEGCGVEREAQIVNRELNADIIRKQIDGIDQHIQTKTGTYTESGYHLCIYNYGNVTNPAELSRENFDLLLNNINRLVPPPKFISINSRGIFVTPELLSHLRDKKLGYNIHFILGIESLTAKGREIFGKKNMHKELQGMFERVNGFNEENDTNFGIDAGFVFLPEFFSEDRREHEKIKKGFFHEIKSFLDQYVGQKTPIRMNIHPFYQIPELPYESTADQFDTLMEALLELEPLIQAKNETLPTPLKTSLFIGLNDNGYETHAWKIQIAKWREVIERINKGTSIQKSVS